MATYNGAEFIREQLQSFAAQTLPPDEVVITDDGSADETLAIAAQFASDAPFAVHIHRNPERLGFDRNFEAAVSKCEGDIIFFSDQDDVWFEKKLEIVMSAFDGDDRVMVVINGQIIADAGLNHSNTTMLDNLKGLGITSGQLCSGCATAFRRKWGDFILPMPSEIDELRGTGIDRWVNELAVLLNVRCLIELPLQYFRRHDTNATESMMHSPQRTGFRDIIALRLKKPPVEAWKGRIRVLELYEKWITNNIFIVEKFGIISVARALSAIAHEKISLEKRHALVKLPLYRRGADVWNLLRFGGYRYFYGWKSALRDLTR